MSKAKKRDYLKEETKIHIHDLDQEAKDVIKIFNKALNDCCSKDKSNAETIRELCNYVFYFSAMTIFFKDQMGEYSEWYNMISEIIDEEEIEN